MREEFIHFPLQNATAHFRIALAGTSYCDGSYRVLRERAGCLVAEYVVKGEGTVELDGKAYRAKAGDIYLLPAGCRHLYYSDAENPWEKIWINVAGTLPDGLLREYNPRNMVVFPDAGGRAFFDRFHEIGRDTTYSALEKQNQAALAFHELLQYLYDKFYVEEYVCSKEALQLQTYLAGHITENISLRELSELVFLSESQVVRIFKRDFGKTPHEYLLDMKMEYAKRLLKNTRARVKEIAEYLGFCDEHYFSSMFKRKTGESPLQYRKQGGEYR